MEQKKIDLGKSVKENAKIKYKQSKVQANTLFTFMTKIDFLINIIKNRCVAPRYCEENIKYLGLDGVSTISFPMKCFCDINLHKMDNHLEWYGFYGIGFTKEWGIANKLQPIIYINKKSELRSDFKDVFNEALKLVDKVTSKNEDMFCDYMLHQLMYYKPCYGKFKNRMTNKEEYKWFIDENEWRYIPNVRKIKDVQQIYINKNHNPLIDLSDAIELEDSICLKYDVDDVKYIIVKTKEDYELIIKKINELDDEPINKMKLISKIMIWDLCGGDF